MGENWVYLDWLALALVLGILALMIWTVWTFVTNLFSYWRAYRDEDRESE